jgi:hypothetical protein
MYKAADARGWVSSHSEPARDCCPAGSFLSVGLQGLKAAGPRQRPPHQRFPSIGTTRSRTQRETRGTFRGTFGALRGILMRFRSLQRPRSSRRRREKVQYFQKVEWCRKRESNPRPHHYEFGGRLFRVVSTTFGVFRNKQYPNILQFPLISQAIWRYPHFAYRLLTALTERLPGQRFWRRGDATRSDFQTLR